MPPAIIAGGIAAAGAVGAAAIGSSASKSAAKTAQQGTDASLAVQRETYDRNAAALAPWQEAGIGANSILTGALGFGGGDAARSAFDTFRNSTDYNFRFNEGQRAVNSGWAGAGALQSGAALMASQDRGQNTASSAYYNWLGSVGDIANRGFGAASAQAGVGQSYANNVSALNSQNAATQANLQMQQGNNLAGTVGALGQIGAYSYGQTVRTPPIAPYGALVPSVTHTINANPGIF